MIAPMIAPMLGRALPYPYRSAAGRVVCLMLKATCRAISWPGGAPLSTGQTLRHEYSTVSFVGCICTKNVLPC